MFCLFDNYFSPENVEWKFENVSFVARNRIFRALVIMALHNFLNKFCFLSQTMLYHSFTQARQVGYVLFSYVPLAFDLFCEYQFFQAPFPHCVP